MEPFDKLKAGPIEEFEVNGLTVKIYHDDDPASPREDDNLGRMVCWHRRARLGDEQLQGRFNSLEQIEQCLREKRDAVVVLPIYIYQHGAITLTARYEVYLTYPDKQWDAGQVGFIYVTDQDLRKEYGVTEITQEIRDKAAEVLRGEVDVYDQYLTGDVWGYVIEDQDGEHIFSCFGFFGLDQTREEARSAATRE
jgi:hypothetical protein